MKHLDDSNQIELNWQQFDKLEDVVDIVSEDVPRIQTQEDAIEYLCERYLKELWKKDSR